MGLGTIIGSLMFNTLGVAGLAALCIDKVDPKDIERGNSVTYLNPNLII